MEDLQTPFAIRKLLRNFHLDSVQTGTSDGWFRKGASHWRDVCRGCADASSIKVAELGGSADTPFEVAFSNLGHAFLKDKAPKLLEYEVGFQLVEKNQENTKAVGVFGFKVGDQWLYAPVFFLNGDLKGHELLYIKNQDIFVPLKDNWLNYLLGRKPSILGRSVTKNMTELGVQQPNLQRLSRSPYKTASAHALPMMARWFRDFLPDLGYLTTTNFAKEASSSPRPLGEVFSEIGQPALEYLLKVGETYPTVFRSFEELHPGLLQKLASDVAASQRRAASSSLMKTAAVPTAGSLMRLFKKADVPEAPTGRVEVVLREDVWNGNNPSLRLSDDDRTKVLSEGRLVRDTRPDSAVSKAYAMTTSVALQNPTETGLYEVLVRPDRFEKCLVVVGPMAEDGPRTFCTLVSLDSEDRWLNVHPSRVWTRSAYSRTEWNKWFDSLPDADSLPLGERYGTNERVLLLGRNGAGTTPLHAYEEFDGGERGCVYRVRFDDHCDWGDKRPFYRDPGRHWDLREDGDHDQIESVRFTNSAGTKLRGSARELHVPGGFKKLKLAARADGFNYNGSKKQPLQPGDLADVQFALNSGTVPLKVLTDESEVSVNEQKMDKDAAFKLLVTGWGLRADSADALLKLAFDTPRRWVNARVKLASPYLTETQRGSPGVDYDQIGGDPFFNGNVPTRVTDERELRVQDMQADPGARELYKPQGPDPATMQVAQEAAQTGQREVFDTAMLGGLLKAVRQDSMVDRYLGDLMKGMDRLGRIYFQFLWHGEEFSDRYGKQDLPELEDGIRNAFESIGDIILVLKRKSVEPFAEQGTDVNLQSVAN